MKTFLILLAFSLCAFQAGAAEVRGARLDANKKNLLIDVTYGGGCAKHTFKLAVGACRESFPVSCDAVLIEKISGGVDLCEAIISETVKINLKRAGLTDPYYRQGSLTIFGDQMFNGETSQATVKLP